MSLESQRKWLHLALAPEMDFENFYRLLKTFGLPENIFFPNFFGFVFCGSTINCSFNSGFIERVARAKTNGNS